MVFLCVAANSVAAVKDSVDLGSASVVVDSARYYEDKAIDLKLDGDYLMSSGLNAIIGGSLVTALGMVGVVYGGMFFMEGGLGTMLSLFILPPSAGVAGLGIGRDTTISMGNPQQMYFPTIMHYELCIVNFSRLFSQTNWPRLCLI